MVDQTKLHIDNVRYYLDQIGDLLDERWVTHDASKLEEPELSGYAGLAEAVKGLTYGTPEYIAALEPYKPIIAHHYAANPHHPEHHLNGIADMTLIDVVEMLCDWKAASERGGGDFADSLHKSINRFVVDQQLAQILTNTAKALGWIADA